MLENCGPRFAPAGITKLFNQHFSADDAIIGPKIVVGASVHKAGFRARFSFALKESGELDADMVAQLAVGFDLSGAEDQIGCGFLWEFRRGSLIFKHVNGFVAGD